MRKACEAYASCGLNRLMNEKDGKHHSRVERTDWVVKVFHEVGMGSIKELSIAL